MLMMKDKYDLSHTRVSRKYIKVFKRSKGSYHLHLNSTAQMGPTGMVKTHVKLSKHNQ